MKRYYENNYLFFLIALIVMGCAVQESVHIKDGKEYGVTEGLFRDRWWNYYERGLSYADGEFYEEAVQDLLAAIQRRNDDRWRSRTYGMRFIRYFPHRELGVIFYKLKRYSDARQELENSLHTAESSKAKYFLNRTRRSILEETGDDKYPPSIRIKSPLDGTVTNKFSIAINGEAEDDHYVSSLEINDVPVPVELSSKKIMLEREYYLNSRGINEIRIGASDLTGKRTEKILKINVDREGPIVIIEDQEVTKQKIIVSGIVYDNTGIESFIFNGEKIPVDVSAREMEFYREIDPHGGTDHIDFEAEDTAGNVTKGEINVRIAHSTQKGLPLLALSGSESVGLYSDKYAFVGGGLGKIIDDLPPKVRMKNLTDFQTSYSDSLYLEGSVSDESKVASLFVNGESILKRKGKKVFFNYLTRLHEGPNRFLIEAVDIFGNRSEQVVAVERKIPKIRQVGSRMSISILPLANKGERSISGDAVYESLISAFVNQRRFHLIEREKMKDILSELKLSQTELVDPDTAAKIGRIVVSDAILTGTIYENKNSIEIFTRLVDTETSHIMEAKDVFDENKNLRDVRKLMEGLALKYRESFPLLEGTVIRKDGDTIMTDIGEEKKIRKNMRLILFREGDDVTHPVTGAVLGSEPVELGEAKVKDVFRGYSRATIERGKPEKIKERDRTITK